MRLLKLLLVIVVCAEAVPAGTAHAEPLSIPMCPAALDLTLPKEFRPIERAPEIMEVLSANDARRTRYAAAFTSRTLGEDPLGGRPFIAIGSLGSTLNAQGKLKRKDFDAMREVVRKSKNEIPPLAQEYLNRLAEGHRRLYGTDPAISGIILAYLEPDDHSYVQIALTSGTIHGERTYFLSLAKVIFVQSCFAFINAAFPLGLTSFQRVSEIALELDVR